MKFTGGYIMKRKQMYIHGLRLRWFLLLTLTGLLLSFVNTFSPIHELGHVLAFQLIGIRAGITGWATTGYASYSSFGLAGGFFFELFFWYFLMFIANIKWRAFVLGVLLDIVFTGMMSKDFALIGSPWTYILFFITAVILQIQCWVITVEGAVAWKRNIPAPVRR
jgi:hypothetical protein